MSEGDPADDILRALEDAPPTARLEGAMVGHYRLGRRLGAGGMGEVYQAVDTRLGRRVAIKVLPARLLASAANRARLEREAQTLASLSHPGIVTVHAIEAIDGQLLLVMEHVEGRTLRDRIPPAGLPVAELLRWSVDLAEAIAAAHRAGVVHRDVKPENVMISEDGRVRVLDFGLAKFDGPLSAGALTVSASVDGRLIGTAAYMSPEQAAGKSTDARSDVFSLGIVLFEMATGRHPFGGDSSIEVLSAILHRPARRRRASIRRYRRASPGSSHAAWSGCPRIASRAPPRSRRR